MPEFRIFSAFFQIFQNVMKNCLSSRLIWKLRLEDFDEEIHLYRQ